MRIDPNCENALENRKIKGDYLLSFPKLMKKQLISTGWQEFFINVDPINCPDSAPEKCVLLSNICEKVEDPKKFDFFKWGSSMKEKHLELSE